MEGKFKLVSDFSPAGDQPKAIEGLVKGLDEGMKYQTLLGATGTGKTFTVANVVQRVQKPLLMIAHNKTLAAQLASEFFEFFPENAVHYFVSYYDYYQPEAYMPITDTYIEKDAKINEEIDRLRHASTQSLLTRNDVVICASVSCIYGLGSPAEYQERHLYVKRDTQLSRRQFIEYLVSVHYERTNADLKPGMFRAIGNKVEVMPMSARIMYSFTFVGSSVGEILQIDPVSSVIVDTPETVFLYPAKHFLTEGGKKEAALKAIREELKIHLDYLDNEGKLLEAERLRRRTNYDLAMIDELGYCSGIENYSRHLSGRLPGEPAETLMSYFPYDEVGKPQFLTVIDESHVTVPQLRGMYAGDQARKKTLIEYGFRLPSALDNRPLKFDEFERTAGQLIFVSATPAPFEIEASEQVVEQIIRPTGLLDPEVFVRPVTPVAGGYVGQVQDFIKEAVSEVEKGGRVLATTLTKKMAEDLAAYLKDQGLSSEYLHSDIKTIERVEILTRLRKGEFDCLVGVNLLREGLDLPEVTFIGILDADKEGFLRSETALIQTIGRAARNVGGRVILYADKMTGSMKRAIRETERRRKKQKKFNDENGITPETIKKAIKDITESMRSDHREAVSAELKIDLAAFGGNIKKLIKYKEEMMSEAVKKLDFESAAIIRDEIYELKKKADQGSA